MTITWGIISLTGSLAFWRGDPTANGPVPPLCMDEFGDNCRPDALLGDRGGLFPDENTEGKIDPANVVFPTPGTDNVTPALESSSSEKT